MMDALGEKNSHKIASLEFLNPSQATPKKKWKQRRRSAKDPSDNSALPEPGTGSVLASRDLSEDPATALNRSSQSAFSPSAVSFNHDFIPDAIAREACASKSGLVLMKQIERMQITIDMLQKHLADLKSDSIQNERTNGPAQGQKERAAEDISCSHASEKGMVYVSPPEGLGYRDQATGKPVCCRCISENRISVIMKPYKVYVSTVGECPHCHTKALTSREEREPLTIQPPEAGEESCCNSGSPSEDPV